MVFFRKITEMRKDMWCQKQNFLFVCVTRFFHPRCQPSNVHSNLAGCDVMWWIFHFALDRESRECKEGSQTLYLLTLDTIPWRALSGTGFVWKLCSEGGKTQERALILSQRGTRRGRRKTEVWESRRTTGGILSLSLLPSKYVHR
jgi:hypothetical protein